MNYWFPYLTIVITLCIVAFMPKHLTKREIYHTWWVLASITVYTDLLFGDVLDLYDLGADGLQLLDLPVEALLPPSIGIIYLNFLPKNKRRHVVYIMGWTVFSVVYEWLAILCGFEKLKEWSLWYSALVYLLVFLFLRWHLYFIRSGR
ncbi:hypothetical protein [Ammoniphilus resinae]|uniref:Uncharacterized protein n=1 Tax=Ammoniphilus resinae TaxID=861532 RepID=A0ABS4GXS0_9BACL|nr:hypothetical protein [Ammoniphilus resinae]MBP1935073.1 hypothetical protein [Ammoniphilus resinae]